MKHLRKFEKFKTLKKREVIIKESVLQVNDIYKVRTFIDIPQSLINAYVKKVKDNTGKNLRQFFGDVDVAEEVVKYINTNFLNVDQIPAGALMGDAPQAQGDSQSQTQAPQTQVPQAQAQTQIQPQAQTQPEVPQAQAPQSQAQAPQAQTQPQVQVQAEAQPQSQSQSQGDDDFEEVQDKEESEENGDNEELPL